MADSGMDDHFAAIFDAHDAGQSASTMFADATAIIRLAHLDTLAYARQRKTEAKALGISVSTLDREVQAHQRSMRVQTVASAGRPWLTKAQLTQQGEVRSNLLNALLPLRDDPRVSHIVRYDEMQRLPILMQPIPGSQLDGHGFDPRPADDPDYTLVQEWLQSEGLETVGITTVQQALDVRSRELAFHPVRGWLDGVTWDGTARLADWLSTYLGVDSTEYSKVIGTLFLTSMIARVRQPGCKCDYMLVLEGPQGAHKSTACAILAGDYYSDSLPDIRNDKDASQHLNGKWLIEIAEMSALDKAAAAALKAFITRTTERYRKSYGRLQSTEQRQCVFIGTTNKKTYLRDETGGRRFWPVTVGKIDLAGLARDRDQLFAEADAWYQAGNPWWPDPKFEAEHIEAEQAARYESDAWEDQIGHWLDGLHDNPGSITWNEQTLKEPYTTVLMVARLALYMDAAKIGTVDQNRIRAALGRLGWERGQRTASAHPYRPGVAAEARKTARIAERRKLAGV